MRMWMVDPLYLCDRHLLGEHGEIHKHLPSFRKGYSVKGRFTPVVQIQLNALVERHDQLAEEMIARGMNHSSPLTDVPDLQKIYPEYYDLEVDIDISLADLYERCPRCRARIDGWDV